MQYFQPIFELATLQPPQKEFRNKIGGVPWGLPANLWPICCGRPTKLIAQLRHEPPMLDLGGEGQVLHLFHCLECTMTYEAFILHELILASGLSTLDGFDVEAKYGGRLVGEASIVGWNKCDDGIPIERLQEFFHEQSLWKLHEEYGQIDWFNSREATKFSGSPRWTGNGPMGFPPPPFEYLFQLDSSLFVDGSPPHADEVGCTVTYYRDGNVEARIDSPHSANEKINAPWYIQHEIGASYYYFTYTNLAFDGTLYVFIDRTQQPHVVKWFINR